MFLRFNRRFKDGKEHRYWNIVESKRCAGGRVVQRQVLYLGEINDSQQRDWCRAIEVFDEGTLRHTQLALFPADRAVPEHAQAHGVQVRLDAMELHRPRQWGACWLACQLYEQLGLDRFWAERLPPSREGTCWQHIVQTLVELARRPHTQGDGIGFEIAILCLARVGGHRDCYVADVFDFIDRASLGQRATSGVVFDERSPGGHSGRKPFAPNSGFSASGTL